MSSRFYLDAINPLRGLSAGGVVSLIEEGERGYYSRLQWLYRSVEKRNATARAVKRRLLSSLGALQWSIKTEDVGEDVARKAMAERQAEHLRATYARIGNLRKALRHLALAELRGFAHLEKIYALDGDNPWAIIELRPVEQWFLCRDGLYGAWQYNADARESNQGTPIPQEHWIVREVDDPADEIIAEMHVKQAVNDSDWDGYLEDYGIPPMFIIGPPNVTPEMEAKYQAAAEKAVSAARGYLPNGSSMESPPAGSSGGSSIFKERLEYLGGQIVIAGTSGKLTILTESGSGTLAGGAQKDAFDDIAQAIASEVAESMQSQFDEPELARAFPGEPVLAFFEYGAVDEEDSSAVADDALKYAQAGYTIDEQELSERSGFTLTRQVAGGQSAGGSPAAGPTLSITPPEVIGPEVATAQSQTKPTIEAAPQAVTGAPPAGGPGGTDSLITDSLITPAAAALRVTPEFLGPAATALDALIAKASDGSVSDDELLASAQQLLDQLPELAAKMDVTGVATALETAMRTAAARGVQG